MKMRSIRLRLVISACALMTAWLACGTQPVPLAAVEGTTIMVAIPRGFPTGYGRARVENLPMGSAPLLEDYQRGEMTFSLTEIDGTMVVETLYVRYIARVGASPLAGVALADSPDYVYGQALAFVDLPQGLVSDGVNSKEFLIKVGRKRRDQSGNWESLPTPTTISGHAWYGWADTPNGISVRVFNGDGVDRFTQRTGWDNVLYGLMSESIAGELNQLVPLPYFALMVPPPGQGAPPAAWEVELSYPAQKVTIQGVTPRTANPGAAMVSWVANEPVNTGCAAQDATLRIQVVDPSRFAEGVWVAYSLDDFTNCGRVVDTDFTVVSASQRAYDLNGAPIAFSFQKDFSGIY
jgi:hypothetical protein